MGWTDQDNIPDGWHICDGEDGTIDLRGKFLLGASAAHPVGAAGGEEKVTLTVDEMPKHRHGLTGWSSQSSNNSDRAIIGPNTTAKNSYTDYLGDSQAHNNMPPYYTIIWIQKMQDDPEPVTMYSVKCPVGCIMIWSGTADNIPDGWALCDGQDGRPDFRDKFVLGAGENHPVDEEDGEEEHTLTANEMPSHTHIVKAYNSGVGHTADLNLYVRGPSSTDITGWLSTQNGPNYSRLNGGIEQTGRGESHNNMPPFISKLYIIKVAPDETDGVIYTAGKGITIENDTISAETPIKYLTQVEYNALPEKDPNTLYVTPGGAEVGSNGGNAGYEEYSTEEVVIGRWIDGKPLYRKVFQFTSPTSSSITIVATIPDGIQTVKLYGGVYASIRNSFYPIPFTGTGGDLITVYVDGQSIQFFMTQIAVNGSGAAGRPAYAVLEYTKTTDEPETIELSPAERAVFAAAKAAEFSNTACKY